MRQINIEVSDELFEAVERLSERQDRPKARIARSALLEYLEKFNDPGIGEIIGTHRIEPIENPVPEKEEEVVNG